MEIFIQVNVITLNTNLSCYNVTDKAKLIKSKNIETGISTMSLCIRFKLNLLIYHKAPEKKKLRQVNLLEIMKSPYYGRQLDYRVLKNFVQISQTNSIIDV